MKDYYKILNISKSATQEEIKRSYEVLSKKYHPNLYVNNLLADLAEEKLKIINEAYSILSNSIEKEKYDKNYRWNADSYQTKTEKTIGEQSFFEKFVSECENLMINQNWYALHNKCNEAKSKYPKKSLPYIFEMQAYYEEKNYNYAIEAAKQSMTLGEKNPNTFVLIGNCYLKLKKYNEALAYFEEANTMYDGGNEDILEQIEFIKNRKKLTL